MLNGLCTGTKAAGYVFDSLKAWQQPGAANSISWDHFFGSIQQYSLGLKQVNSSVTLILECDTYGTGNMCQYTEYGYSSDC